MTTKQNNAQQLLAEWRCPAPDSAHKPMQGLPVLNQVPEMTQTPSTLILVDTPAQPWHCFWCGAELERVRGIKVRG